MLYKDRKKKKMIFNGKQISLKSKRKKFQSFSAHEYDMRGQFIPDCLVGDAVCTPSKVGYRGA